jgi:hypothetical protein
MVEAVIDEVKQLLSLSKLDPDPAVVYLAETIQ